MIKIMNNKYKIHYTPSGEWGSTRVCCNKYFTTDVIHTGTISNITCKYCLNNIIYNIR